MDRSVKVAGYIIAIEKSMNLTAPHEKVRSIQLRHIRHVNVEKSVCFRDGDGLVIGSRSGRHV